MRLRRRSRLDAGFRSALIALILFAHVAAAPVRVGTNGVSAPVLLTRDFADINKCGRKYVAGFAIMELVIDEKGLVTKLSFLKPLPTCVEKNVRAMVRHWRFKPAMANGKPVAAVFDMTLNIERR